MVGPSGLLEILMAESQPDGLIVQAKSTPDPERHFPPVSEGLDFLGTIANYDHPSKRKLLFLDVAS